MAMALIPWMSAFFRFPPPARFRFSRIFSVIHSSLAAQLSLLFFVRLSAAVAAFFEE